MAVDDNNRKEKPPVKFKDFSYGISYTDGDFHGLSEQSSSNTFHLPTDIYENDELVFMDIELPGVNPDKISINLKDDTLIIQGVRNEEHTSSDTSFFCAERNFGKFKRVFVLDHTVDSERISAKFKNGILHLTVPKQSERRKKIHQIKVNLDE